MKNLIKKLTPIAVILFYHKTLAVLANLFYGLSSRHLKVIGVTGTNGKTTTCNLIWQILTTAGYKTGLTTSINFKIGTREWVNRTKQGMQGRFCLQKLLRQMVKEGCQYAVIETTSEGIKQYRHWGILYDAAVFTNLTPEHIESHGSFEKYRQAKGELFRTLKSPGYIVILLYCYIVEKWKRKTKKISIVNLDDENAEYFLSFRADEKWGYQMKFPISNFQFPISSPKASIYVSITDYQLSNKGAKFKVEYGGQIYNFQTNLLGQFNIYNCLAAIATGLSQGIKIEVIQNALALMKPVPGRMEIIYDERRDLTVIVDYAHDPAALENVYKTIVSSFKFPASSAGRQVSSLIAVLGAVGGGRDKAKRPLLGSLASQYAQDVIITNEDPYDDDPLEIMNQVEEGVRNDPKRQLGQNYWKILDRREAIRKAMELAKPGDIIALTGKGCEEVMAVKGGFIPWDDRQVVKSLLL